MATQNDVHEWNKLIERDSHSTFYDKLEWCTGLHKISKNIKPLPCFIEKNDEAIGVIPLCLRKTYFITSLVSLSFSDYCGSALSSSRSNVFSPELIRELVKVGAQNDCLRVTIRRALDDDLLRADMIDRPLIVEVKDCSFLISLQDELDEISRRFKKSRRRSIRQAEARGSIVRDAEGLDDLKSYYKVYLCSMKRLGSSPIPFQFFKYLWDVFQPKGEIKIFLAECDHKVVAGVLRFICKQVMYAWGAVSLSEYWKIRPMDLLEWHSIKWGVEHNMKLLDLGATPNDPSSGHYLFKESWGCEKRTLYDYHILLQPKKYMWLKRCNQYANRLKSTLSARS